LWYANSTIPGFDTDESFYSVSYLSWDSDGDGQDDAITVQMDADSTYPYAQTVHAYAFLYNPDGDVVDWDHQSWFIWGVGAEYGYCYLYAPPSSPVGLYDVAVYLFDSCGNWEDSDSAIDITLYPPTLTSHSVKTWYWTGYTHIQSVALGDVDNDGSIEIVTGGRYADGINWIAQLCVWSGSLALEGVRTWYWTGNTPILSVAVGDVIGGSRAEIITGGYYYDDPHVVAQLCVWSGSLALEGVHTWYWTSQTEIWSVAVGDVIGGSRAEIITGGHHYDGSRYVAQLCVWGL
jgi:hypothetical protein